MKHQLKNKVEYEQITIIQIMRKSNEKNAQTNNVKNIIQKNKKYDECHKNQNIILKKNIIDISIFKIQKR